MIAALLIGCWLLGLVGVPGFVALTSGMPWPVQAYVLAGAITVVMTGPRMRSEPRLGFELACIGIVVLWPVTIMLVLLDDAGWPR